MKFIHLTDTHMNAAGKQDGLFAKVHMADNVRKVINHAKESGIEPAFVLITGDLSHEGDAADYAYIRTVLDECSERIGAPVHVVLGNHDHRGPFREGYLMEAPSEEPYYYSVMYGGLRLIGLNTQIPGDHAGELDERQLSWLSEQLKEAAPQGTIIGLHHPVLSIEGMDGSHLLKNRAVFGDLIAGTDVIGVLAGHVHSNNVGTFRGICAVAASGTAFAGERADPDTYAMVNAIGYNVVSVNAGEGITVRTVELPTGREELVRFPIALLAAQH
ncbi:metallophosphoesterase [Cohnella xylanilytica]|uniref:Metallophosphoesterase n=1 Tax=Cohnella xylanilytica TaxID=557555 RepID=A0A841U3G0_9BACL|nr:metallophosphoesterase [Cohnella xylanilytica]MBB6694042.1 metallophosphoesterase [Cohnella xylanilytica]